MTGRCSASFRIGTGQARKASRVSTLLPVPEAPAIPEAVQAPPAALPAAPRLYKSRTERKLFGVCGGMGTYLNVDPTILRILFVVGAFASFGFMILLYIAMAIIVPNEPAALPAAQTA